MLLELVELHDDAPSPWREVGVGTLVPSLVVESLDDALAAQDAGLAVLGYTSQGRFLLNCGVLDALLPVNEAQALRDNSFVHKLVMEHEMGELFKVLALAPATSAEGWLPMGLQSGDRTHRL